MGGRISNACAQMPAITGSINPVQSAEKPKNFWSFPGIIPRLCSAIPSVSQVLARLGNSQTIQPAHSHGCAVFFAIAIFDWQGMPTCSRIRREVPIAQGKACDHMARSVQTGFRTLWTYCRCINGRGPWYDPERRRFARIRCLLGRPPQSMPAQENRNDRTPILSVADARNARHFQNGIGRSLRLSGRTSGNPHMDAHRDGPQLRPTQRGPATF